MLQKAQLREGGSTTYDRRGNKPLCTHTKRRHPLVLFYIVHMSACARVGGGPCVSANSKQKYWEILVRYLSFLVFPEGIIQEGHVPPGWNFCKPNSSYGLGLWSVWFAVLKNVAQLSSTDFPVTRWVTNKEEVVITLDLNPLTLYLSGMGILRWQWNLKVIYLF